MYRHPYTPMLCQNHRISHITDNQYQDNFTNIMKFPTPGIISKIRRECSDMYEVPGRGLQRQLKTWQTLHPFDH